MCPFIYCAFIYKKKYKKIRLGILWWSNVTTKIHVFCFIATLVLIFNYLIKKEQKHSHYPKSQKYFHNKPWSKIKWLLFLFSFLIKLQLNLNSTLSLFSFKLKNASIFF